MTLTLTRTRITRLTAAALLVATAIVVPLSTVSAAPSKEDVAAAEARLAALGHELEQASEKVNDAEYRLKEIEAELADSKKRMEDARDLAAETRQALSDRAVDTYTAMGSQIDVLLEAQDFSEFSDRLTFMGAIAESDAGVAAEADAAGQEAEWAAQEYERDLAAAQALRDEAARWEATVRERYAEQERIADELGDQYDQWVAAQAAAAEAAAVATVPGGGGGDTIYNPPDVSGAAGVAVSAAYSVLGSQYVSGAAGPTTFDCSGLTSWAWARAGVYIPHSAAAQYSSLPRVSLSDVQPGDIIYYGNYGAHVALYVGGGRIIHARNPTPSGVVQLDGMYAYDRPWGAVRVA